MKKIVFVPLDERACNSEVPITLFQNDEISIVRPKKLSDKKIPANCEEICQFLIDESKDAYAAVISMDMLLYGGLFPSRIHNLTAEIVDKRFDTITKIKQSNPNIKIYLFQSIMRCPTSCCNDQEPDYYGIYGDKIHLIGKYMHLQQLGNDCEKELNELKSIVKQEHLDDYIARRQFNIQYNIKALDLLSNNTVELLILPQDDSAPFGFTALGQEAVRRAIFEKGVYQKALMYPGADEVAMTLFTRIINEIYNKKPKIYIKYASALAKYSIPKYEDRPLEETLKAHIMATGCYITETLEESDFVLAVTAPSKEMDEAGYQPILSIPYCVERNLPELVNFINLCVKENKPVAILDNAYSNGGEVALIDMLNQSGILLNIIAYAGWNTNANSLGTTLAQAIRWINYGADNTHYNFLVKRYIEDAIYMGGVRRKTVLNELPKLGLTFKNIKEERGDVSKIVHDKILNLNKKYLSTINDSITLNDVYMENATMHTAIVKINFEKDAVK